MHEKKAETAVEVVEEAMDGEATPLVTNAARTDTSQDLGATEEACVSILVELATSKTLAWTREKGCHRRTNNNERRMRKVDEEVVEMEAAEDNI